MKDLTIQDTDTIIRRDENRVLEVKKTTGEIVAGMSSGCAFLNTDGGGNGYSVCCFIDCVVGK